MEQELGRQVRALGIVLLPSYSSGEPRNEPGQKQEDEMSTTEPNKTRTLFSLCSAD